MRAEQNLRLMEQPWVEWEFAGRLLADAGEVPQADTIAQAVSYLERLLSRTNTVGVIHAEAGLLVAAVAGRAVIRSGSVLRSRPVICGCSATTGRCWGRRS